MIVSSCETDDSSGPSCVSCAPCRLLLTMHLLSFFLSFVQESRRPPVQSGRGVHHQRRPGGFYHYNLSHVTSLYIPHNGLFFFFIKQFKLISPRILSHVNSVTFIPSTLILPSDNMCNNTTNFYQIATVIKKMCLCVSSCYVSASQNQCTRVDD